MKLNANSTLWGTGSTQMLAGIFCSQNDFLSATVERTKEVFDQDYGGCGMTMALDQISKAGIQPPICLLNFFRIVAPKTGVERRPYASASHLNPEKLP